MTWTVKKLERIPEVYRDFMTVLKPVVDSRAPEVVLKINGFHLGTIYEQLSTAYDYEIAQVRQIAQTFDNAASFKRMPWASTGPRKKASG